MRKKRRRRCEIHLVLTRTRRAATTMPESTVLHDKTFHDLGGPLWGSLFQNYRFMASLFSKPCPLATLFGASPDFHL